MRPFSVYSKTAYSSVMTLPVGPAYIASMLEAAGYSVDIIDAQGESILDLRSAGNGRYKIQGLSTEEIVARIDPDAAVLGISLMFSQEWPLHRELLREIHRAYPDLIIVAGGEHSTAMPELLLESDVGIGYVVKGEGEIPFLELIHRLVTDDPHNDIGGIVYIDREGNYVDGGLSRRILDIDNLPWPAWDKCEVPAYFTGNWSSGIAHGRNMPILATRGFPYQCTFCSNPTMWTTRYVMRDPALVVDEIEHLIETYSANSIDFADLTAIVRTDWILSFCAELERRKLRTETGNSRPGHGPRLLMRRPSRPCFDPGVRSWCSPQKADPRRRWTRFANASRSTIFEPPWGRPSPSSIRSRSISSSGFRTRVAAAF